jgi:hypothetical protein
VFDFFKTPRDKSAGSDTSPDDSRFAPHPAPSMSKKPEHAVSSRELVRVVLRDTLRKHGIPTDWVGCQIASRTQSGQATAHQIQLVILKWHEGLFRFAPLLQQQILQGLQQFDPQSDHSGHGVVWSFAPNCGCPYTTMPAPTYWSATAEKQKFDLPPTARKFHEVDDDFATTVPSPLR